MRLGECPFSPFCWPTDSAVTPHLLSIESMRVFQDRNNPERFPLAICPSRIQI